MPDLPTKSQIRSAIAEGQPPSLELDRLVCLCFFSFYSTPPPFSSDEPTVSQLIDYFMQQFNRSMEVTETADGRWRCNMNIPSGSICCLGTSFPHAIVNATLWYAACRLCVNDEPE